MFRIINFNAINYKYIQIKIPTYPSYSFYLRFDSLTTFSQIAAAVENIIRPIMQIAYWRETNVCWKQLMRILIR